MKETGEHGPVASDKRVNEMDGRERSLLIDGMTPKGGLYTDVQRPVHENSNSAWRVSPEPFWMPQAILEHYEAMGRHLLRFYKSANLLYSQSARGIQPAWIADYLDRGKPDEVVAFGRMNRFRSQLPLVIRPDVIPTKDGMIASELDSLPGGIGFTGSLGERYAKLGYGIVGGADGMVSGFERMIRVFSEVSDPVLAIIVSDESSGYRPEMNWLGEALSSVGLETYVIAPEEICFSEAGLFVEGPSGRRQVDVIYRFFELFDLRNIPKIDLILYAVRKGLVRITPPLKAHLEEKMWMALLHHPMLLTFWSKELGEESLEFLRQLFPETWMLDPTPLPPYGVIPGLEVGSRKFTDWRDLGGLGQKARQFVIKPSGFSERAWGSRGVSVGHDLPEESWREVIESALQSFDTSPHILQRFHTGSRFSTDYYDFESDSIQRQKGRVRIQPYYFVVDNESVLGGIQATLCPSDKKLLHGMVDAVVIPCAVRDSTAGRGPQSAA